MSLISGQLWLKSELINWKKNQKKNIQTKAQGEKKNKTLKIPKSA